MNKIYLFFAFLSLTLISCDRDDSGLHINDPNTSDVEVTTKIDTNNTIIDLCSYRCLVSGFTINVQQNISNNAIIYHYRPIETIVVNHDYHSNLPPVYDSSYPYPYFYESYKGDYSNSTGAPVYDFEGNVITGQAYLYRHVDLPDMNWCDSFFSTNELHNIQIPCNLNQALISLNSSPNKPSGCNADISCYSGAAGGVVLTPSHSDHVVKPDITLTNKYGKLCFEEEPGFCFYDENGSAEPMEPLNPTDPNMGPTTYSYLDFETIKVKFWRDVEKSSIEVSKENNELSDTVINWFDLPSSVKIKSGAYPVIEDGTEFGHIIIKLQYN